jgi:serine/threonine protein kinase
MILSILRDAACGIWHLHQGLATNYFLFIMCGIYYDSSLFAICAENVIHRDIAARNVLLNELFVAQVTDFGMSRLLDDDEETSYNVTQSSFGPIRYMVNECYFRSDVHDVKKSKR